MLERCVKWLDGVDGPYRCSLPASHIFWGKLFDLEFLGPRCYKHALEQVTNSYNLYDPGYAIYNLTKVTELVDVTRELLEVSGGGEDLRERALSAVERVTDG